MSSERSTEVSGSERRPDVSRQTIADVDVTVVLLQRSHFAAAAAVLARAFEASRLHRAVFGPSGLARSESNFLDRLHRSDGTRLGAFERDRLVGVAIWSTGGTWRAEGLPTRSALRLIASMTPAPAHVGDVDAEQAVHLGPIGVLPDRQRCGIGSRLMHRYCEALDANGQAGRLETESVEGVAFYRRFEFDILRDGALCDGTHYVMERPRLEGEPLTPARVLYATYPSDVT